MKNRVKSLLTIGCALAITLGSLLYIYEQFQSDMPGLKSFAKKSFYQLIHKKEPPASKTKTPADLGPLAKLTVKPANALETPSPPGPANLPAVPNTDNPVGFVTLNIHGVMSDGPNNVVLINDQVYQEGDEVHGVKIIKISLDSITVINNGKEETIRVKN